MTTSEHRRRGEHVRRSTGNVRLREVRASDLPKFFEHQLDPEANRMAAFGAKDPTDREAFMDHWGKIRRDPKSYNRTVLVDGRVVGNIGFFEQFGKPSISYWYAREVWGQGVATLALRAFLGSVLVRPVFARVAKENPGSLRVLEKCGFVVVGREKGFSEPRAAEVEEIIVRRDAP